MSKKDFIAVFELTLISANLDVIGLSLLDENTLEVVFKGGGRRKVNITADSYGAIICDVMKYVF